MNRRKFLGQSAIAAGVAAGFAGTTFAQTNTQVIDIERGWKLDHEDLAAKNITLLAGHNILELKYHARVPAVFRRLIEEFALKPQTASKYRLAVAAVRPTGRDVSAGLRAAGDAPAYV